MPELYDSQTYAIFQEYLKVKMIKPGDLAWDTVVSTWYFAIKVDISSKSITWWDLSLGEKFVVEGADDFDNVILVREGEVIHGDPSCLDFGVS